MSLRKCFFLLLTGLVAFGGTSRIAVFSQEVPAIKVQDLKASPQRYWASFFVFSDVLREKPTGKALKLDNRPVIRFQTKTLGDVYAETEILDLFADMTVGEEYLYVATVGQRKRSFLGFFRRTSFVVVVRDITPFEKTVSDVPTKMAGINMESATNEFNRVFMALDEIVREVNKDMFGYASTQNIPLNQVFGDPEHRGKIAASVRTALRKFEDRNRTSSQEFFVSVIISIMALQYGYVEPVQPAYEPEALTPVAPVTLEAGLEEAADYGAPESWDLADPESVPVIETAPVEVRVEPEAVPEPEPAGLIDWEGTDDPEAEKPREKRRRKTAD